MISIASELTHVAILVAMAAAVDAPDKPIVVPVAEVEPVSNVKVVALPSASMILNVSP